jgi:hypothetical protein
MRLSVCCLTRKENDERIKILKMTNSGSTVVKHSTTGHVIKRENLTVSLLLDKRRK